MFDHQTLNQSILIDPSLDSVYYSLEENSILFKYPCSDTSDCFPIKIFLFPGKYKLEAFGASGGSSNNCITSARNPKNSTDCLYHEEIISVGGNYTCNRLSSSSGAGGYSAGTLSLKRGVNIFINIGGKGEYIVYRNTSKGGYNGGGGTTFWRSVVDVAGSGGGATDFRLFEDSLFTRILVAGGGGGSDNGANSIAGTIDDGTGGSGGFPGQGGWINGMYQSSKETTTTKGYSFGYGMTGSKSCCESPGAGGGFFGGYSDLGSDSGGSGGSSFALSAGIDFPRGLIDVIDSSRNYVESGYYKLNPNGEFALKGPYFITGANIGNGYARITLLEKYIYKYIEKMCSTPNQMSFLYLFLFTPFISI